MAVSSGNGIMRRGEGEWAFPFFRRLEKRKSMRNEASGKGMATIIQQNSKKHVECQKKKETRRNIGAVTIRGIMGDSLRFFSMAVKMKNSSIHSLNCLTGYSEKRAGGMERRILQFRCQNESQSTTVEPEAHTLLRTITDFKISKG